MENKELFEGEEILTQSDGNIITLTNLRIRYNDTEYSRAHIISIFLDKISSVEIHYSSQYYFLVFGVLIAIGGLVFGLDGNPMEYSGIAILVGLILIALYFSSRKYYFTIYSDGEGKINFHAKGMDRDTIINFSKKLEKAINTRKNN
jgi:hypothetical protein